MTLEEWQSRWNIPIAAMRELAGLFSPASHDRSSRYDEQHVQTAVTLAAAARGIRLWRNNSGAVMDDTGRLVRYGLGNTSEKVNKAFKSSDLIGITPVEYAGRRFGVFTAIECKAPGWKGPSNERDRAQSAFLAVVAAAGGIAKFLNDPGQL